MTEANTKQLPSLLNLTKNNSQRISKTQAQHLGFLFWLKTILSYAWPIRIESDDDDNNYVELVLYQGKRLLNSRTANYSYGNLQEAFRRMFKEEDLDIDKNETALVLGFGLGGVCELIQQRNPYIHQTALEINPVVLNWYTSYCKQIDNVTIYNDDASKFVENMDAKVDLIVVDVYQEMDVPAVFHDKPFLTQLHNKLTPNGTLIFNKVVSTDRHLEEANQLIIDLSALFKRVWTNTQFNLNRFIICKKRT